jgi:hypothetical protein
MYVLYDVLGNRSTKMSKTLQDGGFLCGPIVPQALGMVSTYPVCESLHIVLDPLIDVIEANVVL